MGGGYKEQAAEIFRGTGTLSIEIPWRRLRCHHPEQQPSFGCGCADAALRAACAYRPAGNRTAGPSLQVRGRSRSRRCSGGSGVDVLSLLPACVRAGPVFQPGPGKPGFFTCICTCTCIRFKISERRSGCCKPKERGNRSASRIQRRPHAAPDPPWTGRAGGPERSGEGVSGEEEDPAPSVPDICTYSAQGTAVSGEAEGLRG